MKLVKLGNMIFVLSGLVSLLVAETLPNKTEIEKFLAKQLEVGDTTVKTFILDSVKGINIPMLMPVLKKLTTDENVAVRMRSAYLLAKCYSNLSYNNVLVDIVKTKPVVQNPESPVGRAKLLLKNNIRAEALKLLADIGEEKSFSVVSEATKDSEGIVVDAAYFSLAILSKKYKKTELVSDLMEFFYSGLKHTDPKVRTKAVKILGELKEVGAVQPLTLRLKDYDKTVRATTLISLGEIGDVSALQDMSYLKSDKEDSVRAALAKSLGVMAESIKRSTDNVKVDGLNRIRNLLIDLLNDINGEVRVEAAVSLLKISDRSGMFIIEKGLKSEDKDVIIYCISSIGNYGRREDINLIKDFLNTDDVLMQIATRISLWKIYSRE